MPYLQRTIVRTPVATTTTLAAIDVTLIAPGVTCIVIGLGEFVYDATSTVPPNNLTVIQPAAGEGRWLSLTGMSLTTPLFSAAVSGPISDVTGDGTTYTILFDSVETNIANNYDPTTGIFTAPLTGLFSFAVTIGLTDVDSSYVSAKGILLTTGGEKSLFYLNPGYIYAAGILNLNGSLNFLLTQGDTCQVQVTLEGGSKLVDVSASSLFSGYFIR